MKPRIICNDALIAMSRMSDASIDAIVTDPPYGLSFMGKKWDYDVPGVAIWQEALRVLKPGGHLLAFAGSRTQHRMAVNIEDAGFDLRDCLMWVYGSGFPKSLNVANQSPELSHMEGWGTALKPAYEPIILARKPLSGTVAENVLQHGTGVINVDGCRIPTNDKLGGGGEKAETSAKFTNDGWKRPWMNDPVALEAQAAKVRANVEKAETLGRWPANLCHDGSEEVLALFPDSSGSRIEKPCTTGAMVSGYGGGLGGDRGPRGYADNGSAARFFYCAKASKSDRDEGLEHLQRASAADMVDREENSVGMSSPRAGAGRTSGARNFHPTVKPTSLMRWLVRMVAPPGGVVLDPFMGSGSTGKAAVMEGFGFIGIDRDKDYCDIAIGRICRAIKLASL